MTTSPIDLVLSRLDGFKLRENGRDRWRACCPAHGGRNPSALSVGIGDGGGVLLHCWQGCTVEQVVGALGLELHDLFPPRPQGPGGGMSPMRRRRLITASQALEVLHRDALTIVVVVGDILRDEKTTENQRATLVEAVAKIGEIYAEVRA